jgi:hypothetical protein
MTSCWNVPEVEFDEANLLGKWSKGDGTELDSVPVEFVRFTTEAADPTGEYKYGYEWNEDEGIFESDLKLNPHGNGWFKYKLVQNDLKEIHLMDNGGAVVLKEYVVVKLNEYELQYKDEWGKMYYYHKCGEED